MDIVESTYYNNQGKSSLKYDVEKDTLTWEFYNVEDLLVIVVELFELKQN